MAGGAALDGVVVRASAGAPAAALRTEAAGGLGACLRFQRVAQGAFVGYNLAGDAQLHARSAGHGVPHCTRFAGSDSIGDGGAFVGRQITCRFRRAARGPGAQVLHNDRSGARSARRRTNSLACIRGRWCGTDLRAPSVSARPCHRGVGRQVLCVEWFRAAGDSEPRRGLGRKMLACRVVWRGGEGVGRPRHGRDGQLWARRRILGRIGPGSQRTNCPFR